MLMFRWCEESGLERGVIPRGQVLVVTWSKGVILFYLAVTYFTWDFPVGELGI